MISKLWLAPLLALGIAAAPATASAEPRQDRQEEARIPFVDHGGIRDFRAVDRDTLYIQDRHRRWYKAELMSPAVGLRHAWTIGVETRGANTLDRFSSIIVDGWRYPIQSLVRVDGPPPKRDRSKQDA